MTLHTLLQQLVNVNGSDLFISVGAPACIKVEGNITPLDDNRLSSQQVKTLLFEHLTDEQIKEFEHNKELNIALRIENVGRFRLNAFRQMGDLAIVIRHINGIIPSFQDLGLPELFKEFVKYPD